MSLGVVSLTITMVVPVPSAGAVSMLWTVAPDDAETSTPLAPAGRSTSTPVCIVAESMFSFPVTSAGSLPSGVSFNRFDAVVLGPNRPNSPWVSSTKATESRSWSLGTRVPAEVKTLLPSVQSKPAP